MSHLCSPLAVRSVLLAIGTVLLALPATVAFAQEHDPHHHDHVHNPVHADHADHADPHVPWLAPQFAAIGNFYGLYNPRGRMLDDGEEVGNRVRGEVELDFSARLFDYAHGRVVLTLVEDMVDEFEVAFEEAYLDLDLGVLFGLADLGLMLRGGKFRSPFGIANRLHPHELPHLSYPLALRHFLGHEGDMRSGGQLRLRPRFGDDAALVLETAVLNGEHTGLLAGEASRHLALVNHLALDLALDTAGSRLYLGTSHLFGYADAEARQPTNVLAGSLRLDVALAEGLLLALQTESYYGLKVRDQHELLGLYVQADVTTGPWTFAARFDLADDIEDGTIRTWGAGAYVTYRPEYELYVRLGYERYETNQAGRHLRALEVVGLQVVFILGSHGHDHDFAPRHHPNH